MAWDARAICVQCAWDAGVWLSVLLQVVEQVQQHVERTSNGVLGLWRALRDEIAKDLGMKSRRR
jgi:hypothetical protein